MKVETTPMGIVISPQGSDVSEVLGQIWSNRSQFSPALVLDLSQEFLTPQQIAEIQEIAKKYNSDNQSFVVVSDQLSYDDFPEEVALVPTIQEAFDTIEMENIQRDLGF